MLLLLDAAAAHVWAPGQFSREVQQVEDETSAKFPICLDFKQSIFLGNSKVLSRTMGPHSVRSQ